MAVTLAAFRRKVKLLKVVMSERGCDGAPGEQSY